MTKNKKNILLTIGSISAAAIPLATVISCGVDEATTKEIAANQKLHSQKTLNRIEERWQNQVIKAEGFEHDFDKAVSDGTQPLTLAFNKIISEKVHQSPTFLNGLAQQIMHMDSFKKVLGSETAHAVVTRWGLLKYRENGDMTTDIKDDAKKFIFENIDSFRQDVLKRTLSYIFLNKGVTHDQYDKAFSDDDQSFKFSELQKIIKADEFVLVNEAVKQHLFAKWSLSSDSSNLKVVGTPKVFATTAEADAYLEPATGTSAFNLYTESKYTVKHKLQLDDVDLIGTHPTIAGYQGINSERSGVGIMEFTKNELVNAKDIDSWDGYLVDGKIVKTNIKLLPDAKSNVNKLEKIIGLMPIYASNKLTFVGTIYATDPGKSALAMELAKSRSVYSDAKTYFVNRETDPVKLEIKSDYLRDIAVNNGFKFIKED